MSQLDSIIFGDKKFSDILEEIYTNQKKKSKKGFLLIQKILLCISRFFSCGFYE